MSLSISVTDFSSESRRASIRVADAVRAWYSSFESTEARVDGIEVGVDAVEARDHFVAKIANLPFHVGKQHVTVKLRQRLEQFVLHREHRTSDEVVA
jgi:hypothetical protein